MRIPVTFEHIAAGDHSPHGNPIARAIVAATGTGKRVATWIGRVSFTDESGRVCYHLPEACDIADTQFTKTGVMQAFEFTLERVPVPCHEACDRDGTNQRPTKPRE